MIGLFTHILFSAFEDYQIRYYIGEKKFKVSHPSQIPYKKLDRVGGPALEFAHGSKYWYRNGRLHRTGGPALEGKNGFKAWYQYGELYREEWSNQTKWYLKGQLHRVGGPAIEQSDGTKKWYQYGQLHRVDGPAIELRDGSKYWYQNGELHRTNGPAILFSNGWKGWALDGVEFGLRFLVENKFDPYNITPEDEKLIPKKLKETKSRNLAPNPIRGKSKTERRKMAWDQFLEIVNSSKIKSEESEI